MTVTIQDLLILKTSKSFSHNRNRTFFVKRRVAVFKILNDAKYDEKGEIGEYRKKLKFNSIIKNNKILNNYIIFLIINLNLSFY